METEKRALRGPSLNGAIQDYVKDHILRKGLRPGDPIPNEIQLAAELGVGRSSVREAVKALQVAGILEVRHGKGLYVREYNLDSIMGNLTFGIRFNYQAFLDWLQIRVWLELNLIEEVVRKISEQELQHLEGILVEWQKVVEGGGHRADLDQEFHIALYRPLRNQTLTLLFSAFWEAFRSYEYREFTKLTTQQARATLEDHWQLFRALKSRNAAEVRRLLVRGFDAYYERVQFVHEAGSLSGVGPAAD